MSKLTAEDFDRMWREQGERKALLRHVRDYVHDVVILNTDINVSAEEIVEAAIAALVHAGFTVTDPDGNPVTSLY